jgi:hypothetical protein
MLVIGFILPSLLVTTAFRSSSDFACTSFEPKAFISTFIIFATADSLPRPGHARFGDSGEGFQLFRRACHTLSRASLVLQCSSGGPGVPSDHRAREIMNTVKLFRPMFKSHNGRAWQVSASTFGVCLGREEHQVRKPGSVTNAQKRLS